MTVERLGAVGHIVFHCDTCSNMYEPGHGDFDVAWTDAKDEGWIAFENNKGEWEHRCEDCR